VLEGSVRKAGQQTAQITTQLIDTASGAHAWVTASRCAPDVFAFQDEVTVKAVAAIAPARKRAEIERAKRRPPGNNRCLRLLPAGSLLPLSAVRRHYNGRMRLFTQADHPRSDYAVAYRDEMWCHANRFAYGLVETSKVKEAK